VAYILAVYLAYILAEVVEQKEEDEEEGEKEGRKEGAGTAVLKSNNPHLAGGEKRGVQVNGVVQGFLPCVSSTKSVVREKKPSEPARQSCTITHLICKRRDL
jgi:hypothetical protein